MYCFEALVEFDFILKVLCSFLAGTGECQNLRYGCLIIVDPKYIEIFSLAVLNI